MRRTTATAGLLLLGLGAAWVTVRMPAAAVAGPTGDLVTACCWTVRVIAGWLLAATVVALLAAGGRSGGWPQRLARRVTPRTVRFAACLAVRGSLVVAAAAATAPVPAALAGSARPSAGAPAPGPRPPSGLVLDWPVGTPHPRAPVVAPPPTPADPAPAPAASASATAAPVSPATAHQTQRRARGRPAPQQPARRAVTTPPAGRSPDEDGVIVVHRGDSLWAIAAAHLPAGATAADVTRAWHAWWRHNRTVIGDDPDLILPGQRLHVPVAALAQPTHTPTPGGAR